MKPSNSSNDKFFAPLPVFGQLISLVKSANIDPIIRKHKADKHYKKFTFYNHLFVMIAATITKVTSLRDLCSIFLSHANILHHLGISCLPKRSTLSYSNKNRSEQIFQAVLERIYQIYKSSILDSLKPLVFKGLGKNSVIADSTTVGLFSSILRSTGRYSINGKKKGGIKLHMTIEDGVPIPSLCYITEASVNDQKIFEKLTLKPNTIYIMDRGYNDLRFIQEEKMNKKGVYFVTRMKSNAKYESVEEKDIEDGVDAGVLKDEIIEIKTQGGEKVRVRRVAYWDDENKVLYEFMTNLMEIEVEQIPRLYKERWKIEIMFKMLKQNFQLSYFLGDNENAIRIQIWCSLIAYVLTMVIFSRVRKKKRSIEYSSVVSFVRNCMMSYIKMEKFLEASIEEMSRWLRKRREEIEGQLMLEIGI